MGNDNILSKKDKDILIKLLENVKLNDEDEIFDLAITLERMSIRLRSKIIQQKS